MSAASDVIRSQIQELEQLARKVDTAVDVLSKERTKLATVVTNPEIGAYYMQQFQERGIVGLSPEMLGALLLVAEKPVKAAKAPWVKPNFELNDMQLTFKTYGETKKAKTQSFYYEAFGGKLVTLCREIGGDRGDVWNQFSFGAVCDNLTFHAGDKGSRGLTELGCNVLTVGDVLVVPGARKYSVEEHRGDSDNPVHGKLHFMSNPQYLCALFKAIRALGYRDLDKLLYEAYYSADMTTDTPMKMFSIRPGNNSKYAFFSYEKNHAYYNSALEANPTRFDVHNFILALLKMLGGDEAIERFRNEVILHVGWQPAYQGEYDPDKAIIVK